ncbi:MAG: aldehyde ferredoxin oxidoreductase family protein [Dehalococcoidia bacterium]|nr:aldehyde ferredoxin oxidoreductase family protein [Dehalococcoidia bacterium]
MKDGKLLVVDLSNSSSHEEAITAQAMAEFIGGRGLSAYLLSQKATPGADPLGPSNPLIFVTGPAQGLSVPFSPKTVMGTKSPLTGTYLYSVASGSFGHDLARAGFTGLLITGVAAEPTYLVIEGGRVSFRSARLQWGKTTPKAQASMLSESGVAKASVLAIGPAGERMLPVAAIVTEGDRCRTFGRGGPGAVMGSKNLKGVVLAREESRTVPADREAYQGLWKWVNKKLGEAPMWVHERRLYGTGADMVTLVKQGVLPVRNWQSAVFPNVERICPATNSDEYPREPVSCGPYCPSPCSHISLIRSGPYQGASTDGPEYETYYAMGSNCGIDRIDAIVAAEEICDHYGMDTMSVGVTIGFAMECFERGLITSHDTDGLDLRFGNHEAMVEMTRRIAEGEGLGKLLGQGTRKASMEIPGSQEFALHMKGMEPGGYECRGLNGQALQYALSPRGGCHHALGLPARAEAARGNGRETSGKGQLLKKVALERILYDTGILCTFASAVLGPDVIPQLLQAARGMTYTSADLEQVGMRILTAERMFNLREGLGRDDDTLPGRLLREPKADGPSQGQIVDLEPLKDDAYAALGWDAAGRPTEATLRSLGLAV